MNRYIFLLLFLFYPALHRAQAPVTDSLVKKDSLVQKDSLLKRDSLQANKSLVKKDTANTLPWKPVVYDSLPTIVTIRSNPYFNFNGQPVFRTIQTRIAFGKEGIFYVLSGLFLLLALVRISFIRYFQNLFAVFFRASMKQKQIREQLLQTPLASLLLNLLFVATGGLYAAFVLHQKGSARMDGLNFWLLYGYCIAGLAALYVGKYFILKMLGWTLRMEQTTDTYIFIVFLCNKVLAILLLPLLAVAAFADPGMVTIAMTVSYVLVIGIFLYRYVNSYGYINREVRTSRFHFFLYLCAFEVAPLLLIYKVLLKFV